MIARVQCICHYGDAVRVTKMLVGETRADDFHGSSEVALSY